LAQGPVLTSILLRPNESDQFVSIDHPNRDQTSHKSGRHDELPDSMSPFHRLRRFLR
jgi:hypothetical protein